MSNHAEMNFNWDFTEAPVEEQTSSISTNLYNNPSIQGKQAQKKPTPQTGEGHTTADEKKEIPDISIPHQALIREPKFKLKTIRDLRNAPAPEWLVEGVITTKKLGFIFAPSEALKSFVGISLGMSCAYNKPWYGRNVTQGGVLYIAGEGQDGVLKRLDAWLSYNGIENGDDGPFYTWGDGIDFANHDLVRELISEISLMDIKLIIIDTLNRSLLGDENNAKDVKPFIKGCKMVQDALGTSVIIIHHTGNGDKNRMRGSSSLRSDADMAIRMNRDEAKGIVTITNDKQKDIEKFKPFTLKVEYVGESLVLVPTDEKPSISTEPKKRKLNNNDIPLVNALKESVEDGMTPATIKKLLKMEDVDWQNARKRLCKDGWISEHEGKYFYKPEPLVTGVVFE